MTRLPLALSPVSFTKGSALAREGKASACRRRRGGNPQHPYTKRLLAAVPIADAARRLQKRPLSNDEIKSPIRPADYVPPVRQYREVSPGHAVMIWGEEWEKKDRPAVAPRAA